MNCLLVEDDAYKATEIETFLKENYNLEFELRDSYKYGLREAVKDYYDLVLLDMSMLTFNITSEEKGGRPRHFAGEEIIMQMQYREITTPVIIITQFENFGEGSEQINLENLIKRIKDINYVGYKDTIFYSPINNEWKIKLANCIKQLELKG
jgi:DNA-binding NarL/FixJ family response regulator